MDQGESGLSNEKRWKDRREWIKVKRKRERERDKSFLLNPFKKLETFIYPLHPIFNKKISTISSAVKSI